MTMHWQIQREVAKSRLDDTLRAVRFAYHGAELRRPRKRRLSPLILRVSEWLERAVPREFAWGGRVIEPALDADRTDIRLTIVPIDGVEQIS